jgi:glycosyltransferase involved in cell wall biosynthesis
VTVTQDGARSRDGGDRGARRADQIEACVRSVSWAAEVLVVENDSTDDTVARAHSAGATVFSHPFRSIGGQRNAAIVQATQLWVLVLDADERATPALGAEVARRVQSASVDAYRVQRRNWFLGREIRHGDGTGTARCGSSGPRSGTMSVPCTSTSSSAEPGVLDEPLLHRPYATLGEYFEKLGRYSRIGRHNTMPVAAARRHSPWWHARRRAFCRRSSGAAAGVTVDTESSSRCWPR